MSEANNERVYGPQYKLIGKNYALPNPQKRGSRSNQIGRQSE
jgi:hypothetical protein